MTMISGIWGQPDMSTLTPTDTILSMSSRNFSGRGYDLSDILSVVFFSVTTGRSNIASKFASAL
jgi:hypothetical protein